MKKVIDTVDKKSLLLSIIYKISTYICWYLFALILVIFLDDEVNRDSLITMVLALFSVYTVRTIFKYYYKKTVDSAYYSIKHGVEMYYFKRLDKINSKSLERIDKNFLGGKILEVAFNVTKAMSDIFEYMIPTIIGVLIYFIVLSTVNIFIAIIVLLLIVGIIYHEYRKYEDEDVTNYNDLLKDFVNKLLDIRMLNAFSFCTKKLDKSKSNICIIRNNIKYDLLYELSMLVVLLISILSSIFILKQLVVVIGYALFFLFMGIKLKKLLFILVPSIKNIQDYKENEKMLEAYYSDNISDKYINKWNKVVIKDVKYTYDSGICIKIPNFEFDKGDTVSILGAKGMGKSTLLSILSGIYDIKEGSMHVDNIATTSKIDSLYITSNTSVFKISLRDNLTLGLKVADDDLLKLINEIDIKDWYESLSEGLDTILDINYVNIPDSVRQKINILRCIVSNKETLLLDEPTLDLDMDSEKIIANMIKKYWKKKNYIIVASRPIFTTICKKHYFMKNHELLESEPLL